MEIRKIVGELLAYIIISLVLISLIALLAGGTLLSAKFLSFAIGAIK